MREREGERLSGETTKPKRAKSSLTVWRTDAPHRAVRVRGVQGAAVRLRGGASPHARSWIVCRLARGEGDLLRLDGTRDGTRHGGAVGRRQRNPVHGSGGRLVAALGPLARARLGLGLRLA